MGSGISRAFSNLNKNAAPTTKMYPRRILEKSSSLAVAGSKDTQPPGEVNVVVTGFTVWSDNVPWPPPPVNSSWLIVNALPRVIFRHDKPNIRIITYPEPINATWTGIRELIPKIWDGKKSLLGLPIDRKIPGDDRIRIDAVLHCGCLDQPDQAFRLERNSFKEGYTLPDNDGHTPSEDDKTGDGEWVKFPGKLTTDVNVDKVFAAVKANVTEKPVVVSNDPNRYTCAWIYWVSLAELYRRHETRRVLFMHTPVEGKSDDVEVGVKVASAVIQAMIEDLEESHEVDEK